MKPSPSTEFTAADGRRFAFPVGAAFLGLAALLLWRGRPVGAAACGGVAALLLVAGTASPARLGPVHRGWMAMAHAISRVTTPLFLAVVYFLILTPVGWVMRLVGRNPVVHHPRGDSYWIPVDHARRSGDMRRQF